MWTLLGRLVRKSSDSASSLVAGTDDDTATGVALAASPRNLAELVDELFDMGRYALLLRPQIAPNLSGEQLGRAFAALDQGMAMVPAGPLAVGVGGGQSEFDPEGEELDPRTSRGAVVYLEAYRLDRYLVTNRQFRQFVLAGGYQQPALWDAHLGQGVREFVDRTGQPGPRYWAQGRYAKGLDEHPVVGVSWYEAQAFARWVGKRLPSDPEWEKAGCWPVELHAHALVQRRFPWGDLLERERANLWGSGPGNTVPVTEFATGASVGGVQQLVGNVWEWTSGDFAAGHYAQRGLSLPVPMKSLRGGAFDTYFDNQATLQFQSGDNPLARKHNIGFRCALNLSDLIDATVQQAVESGPIMAAVPLDPPPATQEVSS